MLIVLGIIIVVIIIVIIICCFSFGIKDKNRNKKVLGGNALIFKGIENIGATCYFSSTLQILLHNKYFIKQINEILEYYTNTFALSLEDVEKIVPFTYLMSMIINRYYNSEDDSIRLNNINTKLVQCKGTLPRKTPNVIRNGIAKGIMKNYGFVKTRYKY